MHKTLFTIDGEEFSLYDCIGALCAVAIFISIFIIASTLETILI